MDDISHPLSKVQPHLTSLFKNVLNLSEANESLKSNLTTMPSDPNAAQPTVAETPTAQESRGGFQEPRFLEFVRSNETHNENGEPMLNRYSTMLTREHDFPGAQAMLYAAGVPDKQTMRNAP
jgi:hypothetical protein